MAYPSTKPIPMVIADVRNGSLIGHGSWKRDVTFASADEGHNNPTITVTSDDVEKYPQPGDVLLVYPPKVAGYLSAAQ